MNETLPQKKTKIVCTIGPASSAPDVLEGMIRAGMNVARINFAHGDFESHRKTIAAVRAAAAAAGRRVAIMGDLPGPKMRIGRIEPDKVELVRGEPFVLQTGDFVGDATHASHDFPELSRVVKPGDNIYLNDGYIQLRVEAVSDGEVMTRVRVGGPLSSRKGINVPNVDLGIAAFTPEDHAFLRFAAEERLDAVSQSFVQDAEDIAAVRSVAESLDYRPFIIAKIERARALDYLEEIMNAADGIMVARGDLGVEIPIERVAVVQKQMIDRANQLGKPVITATHMLESMISNRLPTRAEVSDVSNAILDGTDCVMLSGETAVGAYPVDTVELMARIATTVEELPINSGVATHLKEQQRFDGRLSFDDLISLTIFQSAQTVRPEVVFVPTTSGATARRLTRFRLPMWIIAFSREERTCQELQFSYGVLAVHVPERTQPWGDVARAWSQNLPFETGLALLIEGTGTLGEEEVRRLDIMRSVRS